MHGGGVSLLNQDHCSKIPQYFTSILCDLHFLENCCTESNSVVFAKSAQRGVSKHLCMMPVLLTACCGESANSKGKVLLQVNT